MLGRFLHKLADELVHVQVAQAHGDAHHLGPGLADLVDHVLDGHSRTQLDGHVAQTLVLHPFGKGLHAQRVDAIADGADHDAALLVQSFRFVCHDTPPTT